MDLVLLTELCTRVRVRRACDPPAAAASFHPVLSLLSYFFKAPAVPAGAPVVNALFAQREALVNLLKAARGLPPNSYMALQARFPHPVGSAGGSASAPAAADTRGRAEGAAGGPPAAPAVAGA